MADTVKLSSAEMVIMATLGSTPGTAQAEYRRIEAVLINLEHTIALGAGRVTADTLNLRTRPALDAAIGGKLARGEMVELWGRTPDGAWICVRTTSGAAGWVDQQWIMLVETGHAT
jgi:uncharacterized protein YgiM (DUF1202 family)